MPRIRQPRVAEIVASKLRDDILSGRLRLTAARRSTLAAGTDKNIEARLISNDR
jgi:hypothetical protein